MARPPLKLERWGNITVTEEKPYVASCWYRDATGKRRRLRRAGRTRAIARANLEDALRDITAESNALISRDSTLRALSEAWWEEFTAVPRAHKTITHYRNALALIVKQIGDMRIREATVPQLDRHLKLIAESSGPSAAKLRRTLLMHMWELAIRHGAADSNAPKAARPPAPLKSAVTAPGSERINEIRELLAEYDARPTTSSSLADYADLLIATGARTSELLALRWGDVDFDAATVTIAATLTRDSVSGKVIRQEHTKTDAGMRLLHLPAFAVGVLLERRTHSVNDIVFTGETNEQLTTENLLRSWRTALKDSPCAGVTPRAFRKAVATALDRAIGAEAAGQQLGHVDSSVTKAHYIERLHSGPDARDVLTRLRGAESGQ